MKNKKKIMIMVSILLTYFLVMMIFLGLDSLKKKVYYLDILIDPYTYLKYERGVWKDVEENEKEFLGKSYKIYGNHKLLYEGILQYTEEKWYAFDRNSRSLSLPKHFFAYRGNMNLKVLNYKTVDMSSDELKEAGTILEENKITFNPEYTKKFKIEHDFNNDGRNEKIYIISNTLGMEEQNSYFSIAYIKTEDDIKILVKIISYNMYDVPSLDLKEIIDINNDKKYELIFEQIYFDQIGTCHEIFEYENDVYKSVKACQLMKRGDEEE